MHLKFNNVNDAFQGLVNGIHVGSIPTYTQPSRNGETLQVVEPMIVTYERPLERVLFNTARDANPFFHLFEALWMLAGRNDIEPLTRYAKQIANYSDDGVTQNGAYGYRWRMSEPVSTTSKKCSDCSNDWGHSYCGTCGGSGYLSVESMTDQLAVIADHLKANPNSRRAVLQMWNVQDDLLKIDSSKDVCCNTCVYFSVESGPCPRCNGQGITASEFGPEADSIRCPRCNGLPSEVPRYLNMTVCNRSNDLIWGMLGANVVHFSFLQEYMAARIGLEVGSYNQFTNNLHVYTETNSGWHPKEWLKEYDGMYPPGSEVYDQVGFKHFPLVQDVETFDKEVKEFIDSNGTRSWSEPFLEHVAEPLCRAFVLHKGRDYGAAIDWAHLCQAQDWKHAALNWLNARRAKWEERQNAT